MVFKYYISKPTPEEGDEKRISGLEVKINAALVISVILLTALVGVSVFLGLQIHFCGKESTGTKCWKKCLFNIKTVDCVFYLEVQGILITDVVLNMHKHHKFVMFSIIRGRFNM